jgi:hypothetical protein
LTQTWKTTIETKREREETNAEKRYEVRRMENEDQGQDGDGDERVVPADRIEVPKVRRVRRVEKAAEAGPGPGAEVRVRASVRTRRDHGLRVSLAPLRERKEARRREEEKRREQDLFRRKREQY